jgi:hypothetical protein
LSSWLKDRVWKIRVAGFEFDTLDVEFDIKKSLKHEPNTCSLTIYNLSETHRAAIESLNIYDPKKAKGGSRKGVKAQARIQSGNITTQVLAGYSDTGPSLLFAGKLRRGLSTWDGTDWRTELEGEDGGREVFASRITKSYPAGTPRLTVVRDLADALGLGLGNVAEVSATLTTAVYAHGTALDGPAADLLKGVLRSSKISYSVQNGGLQFLLNGQGRADLRVQAYPLSETTGLVGSPHRDATGEVLCTALLVPNISPGGYVFLKSRSVNGLYRVMSVRHVGSTFGNDWYHEMSLLPA